MPVNITMRDGESEWLARFGAAVRKGLDATGLQMQSEVRRLMASSPRGGRVYRRGNIRHKASAPGEPPARDRGYLMRSVMWKRTNKPGPIDAIVDVGSGVLYSLFLEYGTRRMAARPAFRPALAKILPQVAPIQGVHIIRAIKK
jgi:hypothetical protein